MKRFAILIFGVLCVLELLGCAGKPRETTDTSETGKNSVEESAQNLISSDMLGQSVYDALQADWAAWNAKSEMEQMLSSHMPGHCYKGFDDWTECEEFLGFELYNPLEDSEFEHGSYVGMPIGYNDAPRFYISYYGTEEQKIERIHVNSGYRDGDIRITVNAEVRIDVHEEGRLQEPAITEDSGERYVAVTALLMEGPVTYSIRVLGETNQWDEVRATLDKVLPYFTEEVK